MAPIGKFSGIADTSIAKIDNILAASINNVDNITLSTGGVLVQRFVSYNFDAETLANQATNQWDPTLGPNPDALGATNYAAWHNCGDNTTVNSFPITTWGHPDFPTAPARGWNLDLGPTPSVGSGTGPSTGGATSNGNDFSGDQNATSRYLYTETSTPNNGGTNLKVFAVRLVVLGLSNDMQDTNNDLELEFWYHAYGNTMGNLYVYSKSSNGPSSLATAQHSNSTLLHTIEGQQMVNGALPFEKVTISLNHLKTQEASFNNFHSIYFIYSLNTGFRGDFCIDNVSINEVTP